MVVFVSDNLYLAGNPDENGIIRPGLEVTPWDRFDQVTLDTRIIVFDMDLQRHVQDGNQRTRRSIESDRIEYFREIFSTLYDRAVTHLNQGGVIGVLIGKEAPIPGKRHSNTGRVGSHDWLHDLEIITNCHEIGPKAINLKTDDADVEWYLDTTGDKYALSISNATANNASVLASSTTDSPIAATVRAYEDDGRQIRTDGGNVVLLPQPRTWAQTPIRIARCIEEIGRKELPDSVIWDRYNQNSEPSPENTDIERILRRFPIAVSVLSSEDGTGKLEMNDESDVQALLAAALNLYFEDVRREVSVEDFAGSSGRIDLIVGDVETGIEVKITRQNRSRAELVEQLTKAKASYTRHSDIARLFIFIYVADPAHRPNIPEIRNDIEDGHTRLAVVPQ